MARIDFSKTDIILANMEQIDPESRPYRVGIFPVPGFALMSYACTVEPLRAANLLSGKQLYEVIHFDQGSASASSGSASVAGTARVGETPELDLFLIIAGGDPSAFADKKVFGWLSRLSRRCRQIGGVSGGPVILARAGLMAGRRMTVHWEHAPALAEFSPTLLLERRLFVIDRDRVTCGGGTAPLDLMHALIGGHHGPVFARLVSDWFLHTGVRGPADPQRGGLVERLGSTSAPLLDAVSVMENHISDPLTLDQLAVLSGVTARQLNRLSRENLGQSTMEYYRALRTRAARRLLENSALSLTEIALATGFANSAHFSRCFSKYYGHPPSTLRR